MSLRVLVILVVVIAAACSREPNIEKVPVGTTVQVTRDDGGVVEGKLAARDEKTVTVTTATTPPRPKAVPREDIADVRVVEPGKPVELPASARFREFIVPDERVLVLSVDTPASSETSRAGQRIEAHLVEAVRIDDVEVLPAGSVLSGTVTNATPAGKVKGRASLGVKFTTLTAHGETYPISATWAAEAKSTKGRDAATIGIGAGIGAVIGGIAGGGKGAATGAAIGGGAGTAVVLTTEGKPVVLGEGSDMRVRLADDLEVRVPITRRGV